MLKIFASISLAAFLMSACLASASAYADEANEEGRLRLALIAMKSVYSDLPDEAASAQAIANNLERHLYFIDKAVAEGAEFVGFPEVSINGYRFRGNVSWLSLGGPEAAVLREKAKELNVYISAGIAEEDAEGKRWNTQFVIGPDGELVGKQNKIWLTQEANHVEKGVEHNVFEVKGIRMGIIVCADGTDFHNLKALADNGAELIFGPHANTTGGTISGWYRFRARWGGEWDGEYAMYMTSNNGPEARAPRTGWVDYLDLYAALTNHAGLFNPEFDPPVENDSFAGWASGAWFIGPDGETLARMPASGDRADSKEFMLIYDIPIPER